MDTFGQAVVFRESCSDAFHGSGFTAPRAAFNKKTAIAGLGSSKGAQSEKSGSPRWYIRKSLRFSVRLSHKIPPCFAVSYAKREKSVKRKTDSRLDYPFWHL